MAAIAVFSKLTARPGRDDELATLLAELVTRTSSEPGTAVYALHRDRDEHRTFWLYELYEDEGALDAHRDGAAVRWVMPLLGDHLAGPPEIVFTEPLTLHGLRFG
jgi:quinol monooxygenase YgiN